MKIIAMLVLVCMITGCASYKVITDPPGADVIINGEYIGKSPVEAKANCQTFGGRPEVDIRMEGYEPIFHQSLEFTPSVPIILADVLFWPALFLNAKCPKDSYTIKLYPSAEKKAEAK